MNPISGLLQAESRAGRSLWMPVPESRTGVGIDYVQRTAVI